MAFSLCLTICAEDGGATSSGEGETYEGTDSDGNKIEMTIDVYQFDESVNPDAGEIVSKIIRGEIEILPVVKETPSDSSDKLVFDVEPLDQKNNQAKVNTAGMNVTFSLYVGKVFKEGDTVDVAHEHDGSIVETLTCIVDANGYIQVSTTKGFSAFTITKHEEAAPSNPDSGKSYDAKDSNHDGVVTCDESNGKGWTWSESKKACVYRVTNTSVK